MSRAFISVSLSSGMQIMKGWEVVKCVTQTEINRLLCFVLKYGELHSSTTKGNSKHFALGHIKVYLICISWEGKSVCALCWRVFDARKNKLHI